MFSDGLTDLAESPLTADRSSSVAVFEAIAVNQNDLKDEGDEA